MRPLSSRTWKTLLIVFLAGYLGVCAIELTLAVATGTMPRRRLVEVSADTGTEPKYERVNLTQLRQEQLDSLEDTEADDIARRAHTRAEGERTG